MAETTQVLGQLPVTRGNYSPTETYYKDNVVMHNNCAYYCKVNGPITGIEPDLDTTEGRANWMLWSGVPVVQEFGDAENKVISQRVITEHLLEYQNKGFTIIGEVSSKLSSCLKNFRNIYSSKGSLSKYRLANIWYSESADSRKITLFDENNKEITIRFKKLAFIGEDENELGIKAAYNWSNHSTDINYVVKDYLSSPIQFNDFGDKTQSEIQSEIQSEKSEILQTVDLKSDKTEIISLSNNIDKKFLEERGITVTNESVNNKHKDALSRIISIQSTKSLVGYRLAAIWVNDAKTLRRIILTKDNENLLFDFKGYTQSNSGITIVYNWDNFNVAARFESSSNPDIAPYYLNNNIIVDDNIEKISSKVADNASDISANSSSISSLQASVTSLEKYKKSTVTDFLFEDKNKVKTYKDAIASIKGIYVDKMPEQDSLILYKFINRNIAFALGSAPSKYEIQVQATNLPNFFHLVNSKVSIYMYVDWDELGSTEIAGLRISLTDRIYSLRGQEFLKTYIDDYRFTSSNDVNIQEIPYTSQTATINVDKHFITNSGPTNVKVYNVIKDTLYVITCVVGNAPYSVCFAEDLTDASNANYIDALFESGRQFYWKAPKDGYVIISNDSTLNTLIPIKEKSPLKDKTIAFFGDSIGQLMAEEKGQYKNSLSFKDTKGNTYTRNEVSLKNGITYVTSSLSDGTAEGNVTDSSIRVETVNSAQETIDSMGWDALKEELGAKRIVNCSFGSGRIVEKGWESEYPSVSSIEEDSQPDPWDGLSASLPNAVKMLLRLYREKKCDAPDCCVIWMGVNGADQIITDTYEEAMKIPYSTLANDFEGYNYRKKFYAALRYAIETLYRNFPYTNIILISPAQTSRGDNNLSGTTLAYRGYQSLSKVGEAMKIMSDRYACSFVDATHTLGVSNFAYQADSTSGSNVVATGENLGNLMPLFFSDGLHPNTKGKVIWKNFLASRLNNLYFDKK